MHNHLIGDLPETLKEKPKRFWSFVDRKQENIYIEQIVVKV